MLDWDDRASKMRAADQSDDLNLPAQQAAKHGVARDLCAVTIRVIDCRRNKGDLQRRRRQAAI